MATESPCHKGTELKQHHSGAYWFCAANKCQNQYNEDGSEYVPAVEEPTVEALTAGPEPTTDAADEPLPEPAPEPTVRKKKIRKKH